MFVEINNNFTFREKINGLLDSKQTPDVQPKIVAEGGVMTVFCMASGNPVPTISLYIGGHLIRQEVGRHMVTTIQSVTKDMEHILCYATNGYGVPTQSERKIKINCKITF